MSHCLACNEPLTWSGDYHHLPECTNPDCRESQVARDLRWDWERFVSAQNKEPAK